MVRKPSASLPCGQAAVDWARTQAEYYHEGQFRRDGKTPYIKHPEAVANAVTSWQAKCVAWLHDVLEDTCCTEELLRKCLHGTIVDAVVALTKKEGEDYEEYIARVKDTPYAAMVKIADIQHNLSDKPTAKQKAKYEKALKLLVSAVSDVSKAANKPNIREDVRELLENRHLAIIKFTYCFQGCDPMGFPLPCYADITMTVHDIVNWYRLLRMPNAWDVDVLTRFLDSVEYWVQVFFSMQQYQDRLDYLVAELETPLSGQQRFLYRSEIMQLYVKMAHHVATVLRQASRRRECQH